MATREAVANAIFHGNGGDANKKVFLTVSFREMKLIICVRDEGQGFDLSDVPNPLDQANLGSGSGRGLRLMNCLMDGVKIHNRHSGTEVVMIKNLQGTPKGESGNELKDKS